MKITRQNYEEFFILYLDNELSLEDRREVELFAENNPDLKEELDALNQCRFHPDEAVVFNAKEDLMRASSDSISASNYEKWLLFYIDDELTAGQKLAAEELLNTHPHIRAELSLLQKTKLQPEST